MAIPTLISRLGEEVSDSEEETFLLFSQAIPSQNLGFVDAKAISLDITIAGRDLNITQSPGLLSSNRIEGTTGAVVWKINPLFAEWMASEVNVFFNSSVLDQSSVVLELGCGISGIVAIAVSPRVGKYISTDQDYVFKLLKPNIENNASKFQSSKRAKHRGTSSKSFEMGNNIEIIALDWESNSVSDILTLVGMDPRDTSQRIKAVVACDCIYNETLIEPFVRTCAEICQLAYTSTPGEATICVIAQQLRSDTVFEAWLSAFHKIFRVWRVPDHLLIQGLREGSGFVIHVGVLR